ncbi:iripin-3-like [Dermacentor albipictus]|uniref:iripin-3-like n=1 Tax=Dermacentor albipictus TaxID=60249 RepID=UPI0038FCCD2E
MKLTAFCLVGALVAVASAQDDAKLTAASNDFALRLLPLMSRSQYENVFYSPYSVATALAMVYAGAKGPTMDELYEALGYNSTGLAQAKVLSAHAEHNRQLLAPSNSTLKIANAVVVDDRLNVLPGYVNALENGFEAELLKVDFAGAGQEAVNSINSWLSRKTQRKISALFDKPLPGDTKLVLLDAIYFKGMWRTMFNRSNTVKAFFFTSDGRVSRVDTMQGTAKAGYAYLNDIGASLLELPYSGLDYSMTILLPNHIDNFESLRRGLSRKMLSNAVRQLYETTVDVRLPRFKLEKEYNLNEVLARLGVTRVFNAGEADLSGINGGRDLFVDEVVHKAVVEVNEQGSEASAVTGASTLIVSGPITFYVDHSFLFFIRNTRTADIIFVGIVNHIE